MEATSLGDDSVEYCKWECADYMWLITLDQMEVAHVSWAITWVCFVLLLCWLVDRNTMKAVE
jgi:hypothetical protein